MVVGRLKGSAGLRLPLMPEERRTSDAQEEPSLTFIVLLLNLFSTDPVESLDLLLLVFPLFAEGQQLILQVANLLFQLSSLSVETLLLPLKQTHPDQ